MKTPGIAIFGTRVLEDVTPWWILRTRYVEFEDV